MRLWRISEWSALDGVGGLIAAGRWNRIGLPVVYLAGSSALAILEVLVHQQGNDLPPPYQLFAIDAPDDLAITRWPDDQDATDARLTTDWGDAFLKAGTTPIARVPSIIAPGGWNRLLNPLHPDASLVTIVAAQRWPWDERLFSR